MLSKLWHHDTMSDEQGFTLIECAIVLAVIGLLAGGVMVGQNMVESARMRAANTEAQLYSHAIGMFHEKYAGLPGDLPNATTFWGDNPALCSDASIADGDLGTCNGNGDMIVQSVNLPNASSEQMQMWTQLSRAELIAGRYSGATAATADGLGRYDTGVAGVNVPRSEAESQAKWNSASFVAGAPDASLFNRVANFTLTLAGADFSVQQMHMIDKKLDDGLPATGMIFTNWRCSTASDGNNFTAAYAMNNANAVCDMYIIPRY
ncbi:MAG: type II secretion system protein [Alphaproteobacteria bacterium]|nr:MAG: type II secretion system protein [Alphaproteobacteria bacterium]TAF76645.1 MAG: type II secretion system protein [Alphaproteobacteria bacterium]